MTAPLSAERVEKLREWLTKKMLRGCLTVGGAKAEFICDDLLAILDDYSSLRAENEKLTHLHNFDHSLADQWLARAEKAEAENERLRVAQAEINQGATQEIVRLQHIIDCANTPLMADVLKERDELKAELAKQRPLIEAVMGATKDDLRACVVGVTSARERVLRAALKLRSEK